MEERERKLGVTLILHLEDIQGHPSQKVYFRPLHNQCHQRILYQVQLLQLRYRHLQRTGRKIFQDTPMPGFPNVSAKDMSRVIAFLRSKGWELRTTQDLGDCFYSSILRGIALKAEFVTAHLKRLIVVMITTYPKFFYHYLRFGIAATYGHARPIAEEIDRQEREGEISAEQAQLLRLPGPFSLVSFCEYILKPGAWGDEHMLHLVSLLWQLRITFLHATTLGEYRIPHNCRLQEVNLVVVFINGNHYMGTGQYRHVN